MRRFRWFIALIIAVLCISASLLAQSPATKDAPTVSTNKSTDAKAIVTLALGDTFDVQLISDNTFMMGGSNCGPYFIHIPSDRFKPIGSVTVYAKKEGRGETTPLKFEENAIETKITRSLMRPQVKIIGDGKGPHKWVLVEISPEDYRRAQCFSSFNRF